MTAKYSTDDSSASRWESDRRYVLAEWSTKPFVGHRHRHEVVEQRLVVEYSHGVGVDVLRQARSDDCGKVPEEWTTVESIEVRDYGARHDRRAPMRWLE